MKAPLGQSSHGPSTQRSKPTDRTSPRRAARPRSTTRKTVCGALSMSTIPECREPCELRGFWVRPRYSPQTLLSLEAWIQIDLDNFGNVWGELNRLSRRLKLLCRGRVQ